MKVVRAHISLHCLVELDCAVCGAELSRETVIVPATGSTDPEPTEPTDLEPTEPTEENPFTDVDETNYFYDSVLWAVEKGITSGTTETTFSPYAKCERCQVVTFLYRYFDEPEVTTSESPFTDVNTDDYFYSAMLWAVEKGITTGTSDTTFGPFVTCERCMVVTFLYRALVE